MELRQKIVKGLTWSSISQIVKQAAQFIITAILARLLAPSDFGAIGMAMVFVGFASIFSDLGISNALIQKQNIDDKYLSSTFWLNLLLGLFMCVACIALSSPIAHFYNKPELQPILMTVSVNFVIMSFSFTQQALLTKAMNFKSLAIRDIIAVLGAGIIGIILALKGFGVWSLVYQQVLFAFFNALLLWLLSPWRPKRHFDWKEIRAIADFSLNTTAFGVVNYFSRNIDNLLIGKFLGAEALGFYNLAYKLMLYPLQNISWVISRVMFPAFSKIQNDLMRLGMGYIKISEAIAAVTFPLMFVMFFAASELVIYGFGSKWEPAVGVIRVLCFCGMVQSISTIAGLIFMSMGRVNFLLKLSLFSVTSATIAIGYGLQWGVMGVATFYLVHTSFNFLVVSIITGKMLGIRLMDLYGKLLRIFVSSGLIFFFLYFLKQTLHWSGVASTLSLVCVGIIGYLWLVKSMLVEDNLLPAGIVKVLKIKDGN